MTGMHCGQVALEVWPKLRQTPLEQQLSRARPDLGDLEARSSRMQDLVHLAVQLRPALRLSLVAACGPHASDLELKHGSSLL